MKKTEIQTEFDTNIPTDAVSTREQAGRTLSYLETWYVIDRMNQVLGQGNWGYQIAGLDKVFEGQTSQRNGDVFTVSYTARVSLFATIEKQTVIFTEVGYGDGTDKSNPGKAHELATKGAVSDALKRAAKNLGRSMGLALYDKTQEFVGGNVAETKAGDTVPAMAQSNDTSKNTDKGVAAPTAEEKTVGTRVEAAFKVLQAQGKITAAEFKKKYQGGKAKSTLTPEQLAGILSAVKIDFPQLNV